jgi:ABC-2 type transport system permease protein
MAIRRSVVGHVARHEFRSLLGDGRFRVALSVFAILIAASLLAGWRSYLTTTTKNGETQRAERARWLNQGTKGPHAAADQGVLVFQPIPFLSAFYPGVLPYTGSEDLLVGHHEQLFTSKASEGTHTLHRLGFFSAAAIMQVIVPLLLILSLYPSFAGEREQGTLRQVLSLGVSLPELVLGKFVTLALPVACALLPLAALGTAAIATQWSNQSTRDATIRLSALLLVYVAYYLVVSGLAVAVSARCATARQSFTILLSFWFVGCILGPVVAADLADVTSPSPTTLGYATAVMETNEKLPTVEERRARVRGRLMKQYGVPSLLDLPVDPIGIELIEEAEESEPMFQRLIESVYDTYQSQNRLYHVAGVLTPLLAVQPLSMSIAGTDTAAHRDFLEAAERYRMSMARTLNEAIAYNPDYKKSAVFPGTDIIVSQAGRELWGRIPEFAYRPALFGSSWSKIWGSAALLFAWVVFALWFLWRSVSRLRVD